VIVRDAVHAPAGLHQFEDVWHFSHAATTDTAVGPGWIHGWAVMDEQSSAAGTEVGIYVAAPASAAITIGAAQTLEKTTKFVGRSSTIVARVASAPGVDSTDFVHVLVPISPAAAVTSWLAKPVVRTYATGGNPANFVQVDGAFREPDAAGTMVTAAETDNWIFLVTCSPKTGPNMS
jgi:hypothetical protein